MLMRHWGLTSSHNVVKVCLSMATKALDTGFEGYDIVKVCLSMARGTLKSHLGGHDIVKGCLSMASKTHGISP